MSSLDGMVACGGLKRKSKKGILDEIKNVEGKIALDTWKFDLQMRFLKGWVAGLKWCLGYDDVVWKEK